MSTVPTRRLRRASLDPTIVGDEIAHHIAAFTTRDGRGQAMVSDPDGGWTLHITGTPDSWRHLAKVIEDAAMELERQISEQAVAS